MTKADRELLRNFTVVPHERWGNEQAFSVHGVSLKRSQLVHAHPMHGTATIIKRAIAQDQREQVLAGERTVPDDVTDLINL
jgi:hypothetical protein